MLQEISTKLAEVFPQMSKKQLFYYTKNVVKPENCNEPFKPLAIFTVGGKYMDIDGGGEVDGDKLIIFTEKFIMETFAFTLKNQFDKLQMVYGDELPTIKISRVVTGTGKTTRVSYTVDIVDDEGYNQTEF